MKKVIIYLLLSFVCYTTNAQLGRNLFTNNKDINAIPDNVKAALKDDLLTLTSPKMQGRINGTKGAEKAADYISERFRKLKLQEVDKNYQRIYGFKDGQEVSEESTLYIDDIAISIPLQAYPLSFSGSGTVDNYILSNSNEAMNVWILPAFNNQLEAKLSIEEREKILYEKAQNAKERGAIAVLFYNNMNTNAILPFKHKTMLKGLNIPVFEVSSMVFNDKLRNLKKLTHIQLDAKVKETFKKGINVYGLLNNRAKETIIISANYDGYLPENVDAATISSLPGANNNASGVAALLELATILQSTIKNYNILFIAYSGTNLNLTGSKKMIEDGNFMKNAISYAIHLDKVGRVDEMNNVYVSGIGTAKDWVTFFKDESPMNFFQINKGADHSDYQTYYDNKIPYLNFSGGTSDDNGMATDNVGKINFTGLYHIIQKANNIITTIDKKPINIVFTPTNDNIVATTYGTATAQATVSLGVIPDLNYKEGGILIGKLHKGKDAEVAGIMKGDIIMQIKNYPIQNYDDYLKVMSSFKKGDKTYIKLKRKGILIQKVVTFS